MAYLRTSGAWRRYATRMGSLGLIGWNAGRESGLRWAGLQGLCGLWMLGCCLTAGAAAQQVGGVEQPTPVQQAAVDLPEAPMPAGQVQGPAGLANAAQGQATGIVFGTVTDVNGELVEGARVMLDDATKVARETLSDHSGKFHFSGVIAGGFVLTITSNGLSTEEVKGVLQAGEIYNAPPIRLKIATANTEITVTPETQRAIAQEEVKTEEKQRVLGIVPNYFVTYDKNPVPLVAKQKFSLGLHAALDPTHFLFAAGVAGVEQMAGMFSGFGPGPEGFGKRYGAALATTTTSEMLRGSVFPSLFRQDPRYFYKGTGSTWARTKYALETALIAKGDNGKWQPNYSGVLAGFTAGAISNLYYAPSDRHGVGLTFESGALSLAGVGFGHLMQEFVFRAYTSHVPPATP